MRNVAYLEREFYCQGAAVAGRQHCLAWCMPQRYTIAPFPIGQAVMLELSLEDPCVDRSAPWAGVLVPHEHLPSGASAPLQARSGVSQRFTVRREDAWPEFMIRLFGPSYAALLSAAACGAAAPLHLPDGLRSQVVHRVLAPATEEVVILWVQQAVHVGVLRQPHPHQPAAAQGVGVDLQTRGQAGGRSGARHVCRGRAGQGKLWLAVQEASFRARRGGRGGRTICGCCSSAELTSTTVPLTGQATWFSVCSERGTDRM